MPACPKLLQIAESNELQQLVASSTVNTEESRSRTCWVLAQSLQGGLFSSVLRKTGHSHTGFEPIQMFSITVQCTQLSLSSAPLLLALSGLIVLQKSLTWLAPVSLVLCALETRGCLKELKWAVLPVAAEEMSCEV